MASISQPSAAEVRNGTVLKQIAMSRWTFVIFQGLDLMTTLVAIRMGAFEANPLVAHLTDLFGRWRGVLLSKLIAIAIAMGVKKRLWIINVFYAVIILWNFLILFALHSK